MSLHVSITRLALKPALAEEARKGTMPILASISQQDIFIIRRVMNKLLPLIDCVAWIAAVFHLQARQLTKTLLKRM
jgi:hypothetical protein